MMSQPDLGLDSTYIVSSNNDFQGNKIVVSVLSDPPTVTSMNAAQSHVVPLQVVSNHNMPHQYISAGSNLQNIQHIQTTEHQIGQAEQTTVENHGNVIEVSPIEVSSISLGDSEHKSNSSTEEDSSTRASGVSWSKKAVLKLITLHKEQQHLFDDNHYKKRSIWEMIARKMRDAGFNYSWSQVENKWKSLTKRYRDTVDYNARNTTGITHTCPFFEEISNAYPYVSPHVSVGATTLSLLAPLGVTPVHNQAPKRHINEIDMASLTKKKKYMNQGQNMGTSSASTQNVSGASSVSPSQGTSSSTLQQVDLGVLLRSIHEDRKRMDKVKMDKLEKMHKEKMDLFKQFLDVVKDVKSKE